MKRQAHYVTLHLARDTYKPLVPPLKGLNRVSRRFESPPPALPEQWYTWDRGWYVDVVGNPSASDLEHLADCPIVLASEGVSAALVRADR